MAFVDKSDEEQDQQGAQPTNSMLAPQTASGAVSGPGSRASAVPPGGVSAQPSAGKAPPVQNLSAYLQANAPQAQGMATNIAGNLQAGAVKAQNDLASAQTQFEGQVQAGSVQPDQKLIQEAAANPVDFVKSPDKVTAFQKQRDATYTGPQNFEGSNFYSNLNSEITDAVAKAGSVNPNDMRGIVQRLETNPTAGMTALDTLVLQQNPEAIKTIRSAQAPYATLGQALKDLTTNSNAGIQAAKAGTAAVPGAIKSTFDPLVQNFEKGLTDKSKKAEADRQAYNSGVQNAISMANEAQTRIAPLSNIIASLGQPTFGAGKVTATPYQTAATLSNVASPEDFEKDSALATLLGNGMDFLPDNEAYAAGTFKLPPDSGMPTASGIYQPALTANVNEQLAAGKANNNWNGAGMPNRGQWTSDTLALYQYLAQNYPELIKTRTLASLGGKTAYSLANEDSLSPWFAGLKYNPEFYEGQT